VRQLAETPQRVDGSGISHSPGKIVFQSSFMLTPVHPFATG